MTPREIAERMVMCIPPELGNEDTGSIIIGPSNGNAMDGWQLWTRDRTDASAKKAESQIRGYIESALTSERAKVERLR